MAIEPFKGRFRTCVLNPLQTHAFVFDQPYTYNHSDPANGEKYVRIELDKPENAEWIELSTEKNVEPNQRDMAAFLHYTIAAYTDLCAQAFIHYWGRHEKPLTEGQV